MTTLKRIGSFLLALIMVLSMIPATHTHAASVSSGYCGDPDTNSGKDVSWLLEDGVMTISGNGRTETYASANMTLGSVAGVTYSPARPWFARDITKAVVEEGVTRIGGLFYKTYNMTEVSLPDSLAIIGDCSFEECIGLESIIIPENVTGIWVYAFRGCENLTSITFTGDAPSFDVEVFKDVTATCYYPTTANWPADKLKNYGGNLTWVAYDPCADGHNFGTDDVCTVCGKSSKHFHGETEYALWESSAELPGSAGHYALDEDIVMSQDWTAPAGETVLCLNGHNISGSFTKTVGSGSTLTLCDCADTPGTVSAASAEAFDSFLVETGGVLNISQVQIAVSSQSSFDDTSVNVTAVRNNGGTVHMDSGEIRAVIGGLALKGAYVQGIYNVSGTVHISGGTVYAYAQSHGDGTGIRYEAFCLNNSGTANITGGTFTAQLGEDTGLTNKYACAISNSFSETSRVNLAGNPQFNGEVCMQRHNTYSAKVGDLPYTGDALQFTWRPYSSISNYAIVVRDVTQDNHHLFTMADAAGVAMNLTQAGDHLVYDNGQAHTHTWIGDCEAVRVCSVCEYSDGVIPGHTWVDATCVAPKTCSACGETEGEADSNAHSFADGACTFCSVLGGYCGDPEVNGGKDVIWSLVDGVLTISGSGDMDNYDSHVTAFGTPKLSPWFSESNNIHAAIVEEGVTHLGDYAFYRCWQMYYAVLPASITHIGERPFSDCNKLWHTMYAGTYQQWSEIGKESVIDSPNHYSVTGSEITEASDELDVCLDKALYVCNACTRVVYDCMPAFMPGHSWTSANCVAPKTCSRCSETEGEALNHSYVSGVCTGCGKTQPAATITSAGGKQTEYDTLEDAVKAAVDGDTITLNQRVALKKALTFSSGNITLEMNGCNIDVAEGCLYDVPIINVSGANLTIRGHAYIMDDGSGDTSYTMNDASCNINVQSGKLILDNVTVYKNHKEYAMVVGSSGTVEVKNCPNFSKIRTYGDLTVNNSTVTDITTCDGSVTRFQSGKCGIFNAGTLYITGGTVTSALNYNDCTMEITGGTVSGISNYGHLVIKDNAVITGKMLVTVSGSAAISGGTFTGGIALSQNYKKLSDLLAEGYVYFDGTCAYGPTHPLAMSQELAGNPDITVVPAEDQIVASRTDAEGNVTYYVSVEEALRAGTGGIVTLLKDTTLGYNAAADYQREVLDLNGKTLTVPEDKTLSISGVLYFNGGSIDGSYTIGANYGGVGGKCGENTWWMYREANNTLTIWGEGAMDSFTASGSPWNAYKADIQNVIIEDVITAIGANAFAGCSGLIKVTFCGTEAQWNAITVGTNNAELTNTTRQYHDYPEAGCTDLRTCNICGETETEALGHNWLDATCVAPKTCENCGAIEGEAMADAHAWVDANCTFPKTCELCGATQGEADADAHAFENGVCKHCGLLGGTCGENAYWTLKDGLLTVYGSGAMDDYTEWNQHAPWESRAAQIKAVQIQEGITYIGGSAFEKCENLTDVTISETVTKLGSSCFSGCSSLTSIDLPDGITAIPYEAFSHTGLVSIQIPDSVTSIGGSAFAYCRSLPGIQIPETVTSIGSNAFSNCDLLKVIRFTGSAPTFGNQSFSLIVATALYPSGNTTWTADVRKNYGGTITWTSYGQTHPQHSFDSNGVCSCGCIGGTCGQNAVWALNPTTGTLTISGTGKMEDYASYSQTPWAAYKDAVHKVVVEEGITHVGGCAFKEFSNLETVSLPDSLKSIGREAIMICPKLKEIEIPKNVTEIGGNAFEQCYGLESVVLPEGLKVIANGLFNRCTSLKTVTIPASVTTIGTSAFNGCGKLTDVYYGGNETMWNRITVGSYNTALDGATIHYTDLCLQGHSWIDANCTTPKTCVLCGETEGEIDPYGHSFVDGVCKYCGIPGGQCGDEAYWMLSDGKLTVYGSGEMYDYQGVQVPWGSRRPFITQVEVIDGVTSVGDYAFNACTGLTTLTLADSVIEVGQDAFAFCNNLLTVDLGNGLERFGYYAFRNCTSLKELTIPGSIRNCGESAFQDCTALESVTFGDGAAAVGMYMFQGCTALKTADLPDSITYLADAAFRNCTSLQSISIPAGVQTIGWSAFEGCTSLEAVEMKEGLKQIGENAFAFCTGMTTLELPQGLTFIGFSAFDRSGLTSITVPGTVTELYSSAFYGCEDLAVVVLEEGVTTLYSGVFRSCTGLHTLVLPKTLTSIDDNALEDTNVTDLYYSGSQDHFAPLLSKVSAQYIHYNCSQPEGHWAEVTKPGDCTQGSYTCDGCVCGYERNIRDVQAAPGHDWADADCETAKTCKVCGETEGEALSHTWVEANCTAPKTCSVCGATEGEAIANAHSFVDGVCKYCGISGGYCGDDLFWILKNGILTISGTGNMYQYGPYPSKDAPWLTHRASIQEVIIENGVASISPYAFEKCEAVSKVTIGESIKTIMQYTFSDCTALKHITIPGTVEEIAYCAFYNAGLETVTIEDGVKKIGDHSFNFCTALTEVTIPGSVEAVSLGAFSNCSSLQKVVIHDGVGKLDQFVFNDCTDLTQITFLGDAPQFGESVFKNVSAIASYPVNNSTWTKDVRQNYGGNITWVADCCMDGHTWVAANCTDPKTCDLCGETEGEALGHDWLDADCENPQTCDRCGATEGTATGHAWIEATCYSLKTCNNCGTTVGELLDHDWQDADCLNPKHCKNCTATEGEALGHDWADADCKNPKTCKRCSTTEGTVADHSWVGPTCYMPKTCSVCGAIDSVAWGHDWQYATCTTPETCSICGETRAEALDHAWVDATCEEPKTCIRCGETDGEALGHDWIDADCDTPKTCSACGETDGEPLSHKEVIDPAVAASCTATGLTEGSHCGRCGTVIVAQQTVPVKAHTPVTDPGEAATCIAPGKTEGSHCSVCGTILIPQQIVPMLDHVPVTDPGVAATCTTAGLTDGSHCRGCLKVMVAQQEIPATGHRNVTDPAVEATCSATGKTAGSHCSICGAVTLAQQIVPKKNHTWLNATCVSPKTCDLCGATEGSSLGHNWKGATCTENASCQRCGEVSYGTKLNHEEASVPAVAATCTTVGKTAGKYCSVCGTVTLAQQTIPAKGHTEVVDKAVAATCTTIGKTEGSHCGVCGTVIAAQQTIPAKGHTAVPDAAVAATCTKPGKTSGSHCTVCGEVIMAQVEIPATGHSWKNATCTAPKTCATCGATSGYALGHDWAAGNCTTPKTCKTCGVKDGGVVHTYDSQYDYKCNICETTRTVDMTRPMVDMFRMYDPNSGEHFYTGSMEERENLVAVGWQYEGVGFTFPLTTGKPVHRLYDPVYGEHLYTMDVDEMNALLAAGWNYEGIAFNSGFENEVPQYRLHNPNATRGAYHFTASIEERDNLIALGWEYQGIGWYSLGA